MPLVEMITLKAICDRCKRVGSTHPVQEDDRNSAVPERWVLNQVTYTCDSSASVVVLEDLICDVCRYQEAGGES